MYGNKTIYSLIPARGGSKGIKDKNIIPLGGRPLISYTVEASRSSKYIDRTILTTDSERIAEAARKYGAEVPFMRPVELASDSSKTLDAVLHAIRTLSEQGGSCDVLVLLQPTEPLRTAGDIDGAIEAFFKNGERPLVSVSPVDDHPILIRSIGPDNTLRPLLDCGSTCRRQDMPSYYRVNGCIYINSTPEIDESTSFNDNPVPYVMESSHSVDIDSLADLAMAEYYLSI